MKRSQFVKRLHLMKVVFVMIRVFELQQNSSKNDIMTLLFPDVIPQKKNRITSNNVILYTYPNFNCMILQTRMEKRMVEP